MTGWWFQPLWKIWVRQLGLWHSQYMESHKSHVPNHQPDIYIYRDYIVLTQTWYVYIYTYVNIHIYNSQVITCHYLLITQYIPRRSSPDLCLNGSHGAPFHDLLLVRVSAEVCIPKDQLSLKVDRYFLGWSCYVRMSHQHPSTGTTIL